MDKVMILLLAAAGVGLTAERSPKQLLYTTSYIHPSISNNNLVYQQAGGGGGSSSSLIPYSNLYPFYSIWNNFANVGTRSTSTSHGASNNNHQVSITNQISPVSSHVSSVHLPQLHTYYVGTPSQKSQNNQVLVKSNQQNQYQHVRQSSPVHQYYQIPLSNNFQTYQNLWNFDINNLKQKPLYTNSIVSNADRNDISWDVPLKSYDDIKIDAISAGHILSDAPYRNSNIKGFQRGQVESFPEKSSQLEYYFSTENSPNYQQGFTRGHIQAKPGFSNAVVGLRTAGENYKVGFIREAVEHSNYNIDAKNPPVNLRKLTRYEASSSPKVVCYFASWSYYRKGKGSFVPENADPNLCTHIIYAFANLDKSRYAIKESDPQVDNDQKFYQRVTALKERNPSLKVLLAIGGWSDSGDDKYSILAHSPEGRRKFAKETMKFLKDKNFDGLSLDWHYPKCWQSQCDLGPDSDRQAFSELIKELKTVFQPEGLLVSATLSGYKEVVDLAYDVPTLSQYLDLMNVMAYDYHGAWETRTGHLAPLFMGPPAFDPYPSYNVNYTLEYYVAKGADRSKLILGVPMYGQSFQLSNPGDSSYGSEAVGPGIPGEYTQQPGMLAYYEICKRVKDSQWTVKKDLTGSWGPYAYSSNNQWVGYDDSDFLVRKARFVKGQHYGGMFVWTMDLDDFQNECCMGSQPLLRTISKELIGTSYDPNKVDCTPPVVPKPPEISTTKPIQGGTNPTTEHSHHTTNTWWPQSTSTTTTFKPPPQSTPNSSTTDEPVTVSPDINFTQTSTNSPPLTFSPQQTTTGASTTVILICQHANGSITKPPADRPTTVSPMVSSTAIPPSGQSCDDTWTFKPDPNDCSNYYQCSGGKATKQKCSKGLHWNQFAHSCDWPSNAGCQVSGKPTTTTQGPAFTDSPPITSTTSRPTRPTTTTTQTPWTPSSTQPITQSTWPTYPPSTTRPTTTFRPTGCTSGDYSPGPNCDQYYLCNDGMQTLQSCGPGLHWNSKGKLCDWPNSANCQNDETNKPIRQQGPCQEGEYLGSEDDCEIYFVCNYGKLIQFRCQSGLHWNANGKICDWPSSAGCQVSGKPSSTQSPAFTDSPTSTSRPTRPPASQRPVTSPPHFTTTESNTWTTTNSPEIVQPDQGSNSKDFMIVCYFTNWAWYRPGMGKYKPENIDSNLCTHVVYGFAVLDYSELTIKPHDTWADYDNHFYEQVTALRSRGTKVSLAIGGWNDSAGDKYSRLINNPSARRKFITTVIEFLKKHNFEGLDVDFEYPKCWQVECDKGPDSDKPSFALFIKELKEAFRPHGLLLSAAVSPSKTVIDQGYEVPTVSRYLDWIAVMTYDFHGQWDKKTGHVAPLYFHEEDDYAYFNANYSINYWIQQGADRKKIVMGIPLYGQSFTLANENENGLNAPSIGGGTAGEYTRASGFLAYYEICSHVKNDGWKVVKDPTGAIGPYAYSGNQWVSYDDVEMITRKSQLIRDYDLGGGMIWALDLDDFRNTCGQGNYPLLTTIKNVLRRPKNSIKKPVNDIQMVKQKITKPPQIIRTTTEDAAVIVEYPSESSQPDNKEDACQNGFKPHESDCNKYYMCVFGRYVEYQCAPGTYWNKDHCDWTCGTQDVSGGSGSSSISTTTTTRRPTQHSTTKITTTTSSRPWTSATTAVSTWVPTTTSKPLTSTSWEWKPPIVTTTTILPIDVQDTEFKVVCYFTNWAWYRQGIGKYKPEDIDYNLCTHIAYGFAVLNPSTLEIKTHDSWADIDNQFYTQVSDLKSKGKKVVIAIGGWNDSLGDKYSRLVKDAQARRKFIKSLIEFIQKYNFEGLDLDWEYPKCWQTDCKLGPAEDKANFATFVREIKEAFRPYGYLLSAAVSPSKTIIDEGYDVPIINEYLDWIAVMTYDYHGQWDKKTGHVAPFYNHEESDNFYFNSNYTINYWLDKGADKKKIVMGIPMYGQSFTLAQPSNHGLNAPSTGGGTAGEFTRAQGFLAYYEICKLVKSGWTVVQDESGAIGPYAYKNDQWVSFDDVNMIRRKSQYIKDMGLGGGMIWALDLDDFRNVCGCEKHPLLKTINRVLRNYPEPDPNCKL